MSATRRLHGRVSTVHAMRNLHVLDTARVNRTRHVTVTIGQRLRTNIGRVVLVKNAKNIGMVVNVICVATQTANMCQMNFRSVPRHKTVLILVVTDLEHANF